MNNLSTLKNDEARPEMDDLLHDYFQTEMPHPWPTFKTPKAMRTKKTASFWSRYCGRLALAACVALLVAGYLTLGGFFARTQTSTGVTNQTEEIGQKEPKRVPPKAAEKQTDDPLPMPTPMGEVTTDRKTK